jgi:hypothetical protein
MESNDGQCAGSRDVNRAFDGRYRPEDLHVHDVVVILGRDVEDTRQERIVGMPDDKHGTWVHRGPIGGL